MAESCSSLLSSSTGDNKPERHQYQPSFHHVPIVDVEFPKQIKHIRKSTPTSTLKYKIMCSCGNFLTLNHNTNNKIDEHNEGRAEPPILLTNPSAEEISLDCPPIPDKIVSTNQNEIIKLSNLNSKTGELVPDSTPSLVEVKSEKPDPPRIHKFVPHSFSEKKRSFESRSEKNGRRNRDNEASRHYSSHQYREDGRRRSFEDNQSSRNYRNEDTRKRKVLGNDSQPSKTSKKDGWLGLVINEFLLTSCNNDV